MALFLPFSQVRRQAASPFVQYTHWAQSPLQKKININFKKTQSSLNQQREYLFLIYYSPHVLRVVAYSVVLQDP